MPEPTPRPSRNQYAADSPITFVEGVKTPLLAAAWRARPAGADRRPRKFYRALKALGRSVELEIYRRGGCVLYDQVPEQEARCQNPEWFRSWIRP